MNDYYVTCTYYQNSESQTTETITFYLKAATRNDAFLNAVSKIWSLFSSTTAIINSIGVATV